MLMRNNKLNTSRGAVGPEYAIGLAILLGVFVLAGQALLTATDNRVQDAANMEANFVPCGGRDGLLSTTNSYECY